MIRSILVPLDGSPFAEQALPLALSLARRANATVHLARVHQPADVVLPEGVILHDADASVRDGEQAYLDETARRLAAETGLTVAAGLLDGLVPEALCGQAEALGVDLVVLTTHGRGPLGRFWLGSVADALVRHLPVPALLIRPRELGIAPAAPAIHHILVPLDGSPLAEQILEPAAALAGTVTLLRVVAPVPPTGAAGVGGAAVEEAVRQLLEQTSGLQEQVNANTRLGLEKVAARLRDRGLVVRTRVAVGEAPAPVILDEARAVRADLIALATHGRRGLKRLLLGSVADKVVRGGSLPVLLLRPH
jgi:nucleotide-binding universal stress UspA family protein